MFNDDDLKRLKEYIANESGDNFSLPAIAFDVGDAKALLARLEAAERVIATEPNWIGPGRMAYQAWLKSAGREGR